MPLNTGVRIVCLSDIHGEYQNLVVPPADVLLIAGDLTLHGSRNQLTSFNDWLANLQCTHKLIIGGNHDFGLETMDGHEIFSNAIYLEDESVIVEGLKVWGSPWTPNFRDMAFNLNGEIERISKWEQIPNDVDIIMTHGPPFGILDQTISGQRVGCLDLFERVNLIQPKIHLFGHIHESRGMDERNNIVFVNASVCNLHKKPVNQPFLIHL